jgi:hypothetical protein
MLIPLRAQKCAEKADMMDWPNDLQQVLKISAFPRNSLFMCKTKVAL